MVLEELLIFLHQQETEENSSRKVRAQLVHKIFSFQDSVEITRLGSGALLDLNYCIWLDIGLLPQEEAQLVSSGNTS